MLTLLYFHFKLLGFNNNCLPFSVLMNSDYYTLEKIAFY